MESEELFLFKEGLTKLCKGCQRVKPLEDFTRCRSYADGIWYRCKACMSAYQRSRGPRKRTREHHRRKCLKKKYGITLEQYNELLLAQGGVCCICGSATTTHKSGIFEVEHDHRTGRVRGLVCRACNNAVAWCENFESFPFKPQVLSYLRRNE